VSLVSVVIPSRSERFLAPTVEDVLGKSAGPVEVIVVLDGYWPDPPLRDDKRLVILHRGAPQGMRPGINAAVAVAQGDYLMKLDAHCMVDEGFDEKLQVECADDWIVVPRRHRLDAENWCLQDVGKPPIDAHYLSYPFERDNDTSCGLHGTVWTQRARERSEVLLDDEMSSQGSCWFMSRTHWDRLGEMEIDRYGNFIQEFQELGLKTWLGGGAVKTNKRTWYAHLHKGAKHGRGYSLSGSRHREGAAFATRYWMCDEWPERKHDLRWLVEKFAPVPGWPKDLGAAFTHAREVLS